MPIVKITYSYVEETPLSLSEIDRPSIGQTIDEMIGRALVQTDETTISRIELEITPKEWATMRGDDRQAQPASKPKEPKGRPLMAKDLAGPR